MKNIVFLLIFVLLLAPGIAFAEGDSTEVEAKFLSPSEFMYADVDRYTLSGHPPYKETDIQTVPAIVFGTTLTTVLTVQHIVQMNTIWKEQTHFRIIEDGDYALQADKWGHFYGAYISSVLLREGFYVSGFSKDFSHITAGILGLGYETYVEIMDGFGYNWGFSPSDFYYDVAGAAFFVAQGYIPFLENFTPKFMYFPSDWHGERRRDYADMFIDDYSSQTYWMSINVENMLPENWKPYWPDWVEISVGYAARNLCDIWLGDCDPKYSPKVNETTGGRRKIILALDYNLVKLLPDGNNSWNWTKQSLNYFKLPSPAVEFDLEGGPTKFMLVYPFPLNIFD